MALVHTAQCLWDWPVPLNGDVNQENYSVASVSKTTV